MFCDCITSVSSGTMSSKNFERAVNRDKNAVAALVMTGFRGEVGLGNLNILKQSVNFLPEPRNEDCRKKRGLV